ncbi:MAG: hypothetical protein IJ325_06490 [Clostridia bacterium]|nr:hypothetical protein [Clostridia bacterium]
MLEDLNAMLSCCDNQCIVDDPYVRISDEKINVIAEMIAEACDPVPAFDEDAYKKALADMEKKREEERRKDLLDKF